MGYGFSAYKQTSVATATREKLLLMLYEGAIKFNKLAIQHMKDKNIAKKGEAIGRLQEIITELNNSLDHSIGGEISKNLEALYNFMMEQTTEANITNNPELLENTLKLLQTLYEGWQDAVKQVQIQGGVQRVPAIKKENV